MSSSYKPLTKLVIEHGLYGKWVALIYLQLEPNIYYFTILGDGHNLKETCVRATIAQKSIDKYVSQSTLIMHFKIAPFFSRGAQERILGFTQVRQKNIRRETLHHVKCHHHKLTLYIGTCVMGGCLNSKNDLDRSRYCFEGAPLGFP